MRSRLSALAAAVIAALLGLAAAHADESFYKGKTITIVVGFSPGGGFDTYARLLARHLGRHVPGTPDVLIENMPGAGSLQAVRYLDKTAPADGTVTVTFNQGLIIQSLTDPKRVALDLASFAWLGSITQDFRVCYAWAATGIRNWDDLMRQREWVMGTTSKAASNYIDASILGRILHAPVRTVLGYPGSAEMRTAIERGELEGDCGSWMSIPRDWIEHSKINPLASLTPAKTPDMPADLPYVGDIAQTGEQKSLIEFLGGPNPLAKPFILSRRVPADRLQILRAAFDATMRDEAFLAEAARLDLPVSPTNGDEAQRIVARIVAAPAQVIAAAAEVVK